MGFTIKDWGEVVREAITEKPIKEICNRNRQNYKGGEGKNLKLCLICLYIYTECFLCKCKV